MFVEYSFNAFSKIVFVTIKPELDGQVWVKRIEEKSVKTGFRKVYIFNAYNYSMDEEKRTEEGRDRKNTLLIIGAILGASAIMVALMLSPLVCGMGMLLLPFALMEGLSDSEGEWYSLAQKDITDTNRSVISFSSSSIDVRVSYFVLPQQGFEDNYTITFKLYQISDDEKIDSKTFQSSTSDTWEFELEKGQKRTQMFILVETENIEYTYVLVEYYLEFTWD